MASSDQREILVVADQGGNLLCKICGIRLRESKIALLLRHKPGGPFDPVCVVCTREILQHAMVDLTVNSVVDSLSTD